MNFIKLKGNLYKQKNEGQTPPTKKDINNKNFKEKKHQWLIDMYKYVRITVN